MKKRLSIIVTLALMVQLFGMNWTVDAVQPGVEYYVAADGSDQNSGSISSPFKTLEKARDAVRTLKSSSGLPDGGVVINIRGGEYNLNDSFELTSSDSGAVDKYVTYKAYNDEHVSITGGIALSGADFATVTDQTIIDRLPAGAAANVKVYDLAAKGITDYGQILKSGFGWPSVIPSPELFVDGEVMTLGRYPNSGFMTTGTVITEGFIPRTYTGSIPEEEYMNQTPPTVTYTDGRMDNWVSEPDAWLFGYWKYDWAFDNLKVRSMNTSSNTFTADHPSYYGVSSGKRFYGYNLLCEVDSENEWYLDRTSGKLYLYTTEDLTSKKIQLSLLDKPLFNMTEVDYIKIEGLTFEVSRGDGVQMMNCENNLVADSTFRKLGEKAVEIGDYDAAFDGTLLIDSESGGGRNNGVVSCDIYETGAGGIFMMGGNRNTLTAAGNYAENNHIYDSARIIRTYTPGISVNGVGNRVSNNLIYDVPHMAIGFAGNDHIIELNEIYNACYETSDSGVIYTARDWTYRGNVIRDNYIHDIPTMGGHGSHALYFDDMMSSAEVTGNIINNVNNMAMLVGGGRDHNIYNNLIMNTGGSGTAFHLGNRGETWANATTLAPDGTCYIALNNVPYQNEVWSAKYPELVNIWTDEPAKPKGNTVKDNVFYNSGSIYVVSVASSTGTITNNREYSSGTDIGLVNEANKDFNLRQDSVIYTDIPGFEPLKFDQMGLKLDSYRTDFSIQIDPFDLLTPVDQATDVNGLTDSFTWQMAEGANKYKVILASDASFTNIIEEKIVDKNSVSFTSLNENTQYYWKVNAFVDSTTFTGSRDSESVYSFTSGTQSSFVEDFELDLRNWTTHKGTPTLSSLQTHGGQKSFCVDEDTDVIEKTFSASYNQVVELWFYDSMESSTAHVARVDDGTTWKGIGVNALTSTNKYVTRNGGSWSVTNIDRTQGWHKFTYDYSTGTDVKLYIDDQLVLTATDTTAFSYIAMGDWWSGFGTQTAYFDDVSFGVTIEVDKNVVSVQVDDITEELGTHFFSVNFPSTVPVLLDDNSTVNLSVTWQEGDYNGNVAGTYAVTGVLTLTEGITNTNNVTATVNVHVVDSSQLYFSESFEGDFGSWNAHKGSPNASTSQAQDGNKSYVIDQDMVVIEKTFSENLNKVVTLYHYDTMTNMLAQMARVDDGSYWIGIGVNNNVSSSHYVIRDGSTSSVTAIARSAGWHKYTFDYSSGNDVKCYIDDQLVMTKTNVTAFDYIALGDWWQTGSIESGYFDSLNIQ